MQRSVKFSLVLIVAQVLAASAANAAITCSSICTAQVTRTMHRVYENPERFYFLAEREFSAPTQEGAQALVDQDCRARFDRWRQQQINEGIAAGTWGDTASHYNMLLALPTFDWRAARAYFPDATIGDLHEGLNDFASHGMLSMGFACAPARE